MGTRGESRGERIEGIIRTEWKEGKRRFVTITEWRVIDSRGQVVEIIDRSEAAMLEDDEYLERNITRRARAMFAEVRSYTEERRDGVQRLGF